MTAAKKAFISFSFSQLENRKIVRILLSIMQLKNMHVWSVDTMIHLLETKRHKISPERICQANTMELFSEHDFTLHLLQKLTEKGFKKTLNRFCF
jgi:hypothetical protein